MVQRANRSQITSHDRWNVLEQADVPYPLDKVALETSIPSLAKIDDEHENIFAVIL